MLLFDKDKRKLSSLTETIETSMVCYMMGIVTSVLKPLKLDYFKFSKEILCIFNGLIMCRCSLADSVLAY